MCIDARTKQIENIFKFATCVISKFKPGFIWTCVSLILFVIQTSFTFIWQMSSCPLGLFFRFMLHWHNAVCMDSYIYVLHAKWAQVRTDLFFCLFLRVIVTCTRFVIPKISHRNSWNSFFSVNPLTYTSHVACFTLFFRLLWMCHGYWFFSGGTVVPHHRSSTSPFTLVQRYTNITVRKVCQSCKH